MKLNTAVWLFMTRGRREEKEIYSRFPLYLLSSLLSDRYSEEELLD